MLEFKANLETKSDQELLKILSLRDEYQKEAVQAVIEEVLKRKLLTQEEVLTIDSIIKKDTQLQDENQKFIPKYSARNFTKNQLPNKSVRFFNFFVDIAIIYGIIYIYKVLVSAETIFVAPIVILTYYTSLEYILGKTIGKFFTNTYVVTTDGFKPTFITIFLRSLARLIPFEVLSCLIAEKAIGWHDSLTNTVVIPDNI